MGATIGTRTGSNPQKNFSFTSLYGFILFDVLYDYSVVFGRLRPYKMGLNKCALFCQLEIHSSLRAHRSYSTYTTTPTLYIAKLSKKICQNFVTQFTAAVSNIGYREPIDQPAYLNIIQTVGTRLKVLRLTSYINVHERLSSIS